MRWERVAERQRACVPDCCGNRFGPDCACVCGSAAGQLECCCELQRAERELCRDEQCCEQRRVERQCCWSGRHGDERVECRGAARAERLRGQRLGQRQCCCVQSARRRVRRCCGGCVCWCHAGQRQRAGELRRSECELCCCEQCREQRGDERQCCWARRDGRERVECWRTAGAQRVRGQRLGQRQWCCVQSGWRCFCRCCWGCVCWCCAGQRKRAVELRQAERERCWCEQRCEQRGCECDCCGSRRSGGERRELQGASWRECVCRKRVAERQRGCVPQRVWRVS